MRKIKNWESSLVDPDKLFVNRKLTSQNANGAVSKWPEWPEWQLFYVAGYLIEERRRWPIITASHEDNVLNKFRILKERHFQMRKPYQSPGQDEKLILLYCPGRGLNSRPPAHRSFKHGQGVPRP